jgi:PAS domain S-box-containing protein
VNEINRVDDRDDKQHRLVRDLVEMRERLAVLERLTAAHQREYERLRERAELHRQLVENSQGLVCSHDLEGNLLYVSPASAWELGYSPADGVGRNLREFLAPSVRVFFQAYLDRIREKEADRGVLRLMSRDGQERLWAYRNALVRLPEREPYVIGHAVDITDRIHVESLLRASEERHRAVFEALEEGVILKDADGTISGWNPSAERILGPSVTIFGVEALRADGTPFPAEAQPDAVTLRTGKPCPRVIMGVRRPGVDPVWISMSARPLRRGGESVPFGVVLSFSEIRQAPRAMPDGTEKGLHGIVPICAACKKIRDGEGVWWPVDVYVRDHSEATFSHGLCPDCARQVRQRFNLIE